MMLPPPIPTLFPYTTLFRSLEVGRDPLQRLAERVEQRLLFGLEARNPLEAGEEIGRDRLVAVNVHGEVDAGLLRSEGTRLNSSHSQISYAVFCLKKKKKDIK